MLDNDWSIGRWGILTCDDADCLCGVACDSREEAIANGPQVIVAQCGRERGRTRFYVSQFVQLPLKIPKLAKMVEAEVLLATFAGGEQPDEDRATPGQIDELDAYISAAFQAWSERHKWIEGEPRLNTFEEVPWLEPLTDRHLDILELIGKVYGLRHHAVLVEEGHVDDIDQAYEVLDYLSGFDYCSPPGTNTDIRLTKQGVDAIEARKNRIAQTA